MKIASAESKSAYGGAARVFGVPHPRLGGLIDVEWTVFTKGLGRCCHFDGGRQDFMMEGQRGLYQSGSTRCRFGMTDLGFYRADGAPGGIDAVFEHFGNCFDLNRVSHFRPGSMGFKKVDGGRVDMGQSVGLLYRLDLAFRARRIDGFPFSIAGRADGADDGVYIVFVPFCILKAF